MNGPIPEPVAKQIQAHLFAGRKIEAIKLHRQQTGMGLAESKTAVEAMEAELRARSPEAFTAPPGGKGCASALAWIAVTGITGALAVRALW